MLNIHLQTSRDFGGSRLGAKNPALRLLIEMRTGWKFESRVPVAFVHRFVGKDRKPSERRKLYDLGNANLCVETWHDC